MCPRATGSILLETKNHDPILQVTTQIDTILIIISIAVASWLQALCWSQALVAFACNNIQHITLQLKFLLNTNMFLQLLYYNKYLSTQILFYCPINTFHINTSCSPINIFLYRFFHKYSTSVPQIIL